MPRTFVRLGFIGLTLLALAAPAGAQTTPSVGIGVGGFLPRGFDGRPSSDVLVADLTDFNPLFFRIADFKSGQLQGEWNVGFGKHIEMGVGVGFYQRHVPSFYRDLVDRDTGRDIQQDLKLRIIPMSAVVRFLPFGGPSRVQPYVGFGVAALAFRYSEVGDFVDPSDSSIFPGRFVASGIAPGGLVLGGIRVPIKGDVYAFTFESRYQFGSGKTGGVANGFLNDKIDLSGNTVSFGLLIRY